VPLVSSRSWGTGRRGWITPPATFIFAVMHPMNAEPFHTDEVHPPIILQADDGTPLKDGKGWSCAACGILYSEQAAAEVCCIEPDAITGESRLQNERRSRRNLLLAVIGGGLLLEVMTVSSLGKPASTALREK
jgi:hypothetical protein